MQFGVSLRGRSALFELVSASLGGTKGLHLVSNNCPEVSSQRADVVPMQLGAQLLFCLLEHRQWVAAVLVNEPVARQFELIDLVQVRKQEASTIFFGSGVLSCAFGDAGERIFVKVAALLNC